MRNRFLIIFLITGLIIPTSVFGYDRYQINKANYLMRNIPIEMDGAFSYFRKEKKSDPFFCRFTWQYTMGPYLGGCQYMGNPPNKWLCDIEELCTFTGCYQLCKWVCDDPMVLASCNYPSGSHFDCVITNEGAGCNPE